MEKFDIVSIGDSTIDVFMQVESRDTEAVCKLHEEECMICFAYGSKIPVSTCVRIAAVGNAANNAIGSTRLGLKTAIYTVLGSDQDSKDTKEVFETEGVSSNFIVLESGKKSNFSTVINYSGERTIFVYHEQHSYDLPEFESDWIYLTSVGAEHTKLHDQVIEHTTKKGTKLAFNPGSHQLRDGLENLKPLLAKTDILSVNREEAHSLVGGDKEDIKGLISAFSQTGVKLVLITDGPEGSYASYDGREVWQVGIPAEAPIMERTGAGDAYSTGFVAALVKGKELPEAMVWGTINATSVIAYIGAREGLLTPMQITEWIKKYGEQIKPRMI